MIDLLAEPDLDWVAAMLDVVTRNAGRPWRTALEQLDDLQRASQPTTARRFTAVIGAVQRLTGGRVRNARKARTARGLVLGHPVFTAVDRQARIDHAALMLDVPAAAIETMLWSDLPRERPVELPSGRPSELEVAAFANVALLQRALRRAQSLSLAIRDDDPGVLLRAAADRGLLTTSRYSRETGTFIEIAGPLSLCHNTGVYGRALADLVPLLGELRHWTLEIRVELPLACYSTHVVSPVLLPAAPPRLIATPYAVARLVRGLARADRSLVVMPTPPPLRTPAHLLCPDIAVDDGPRRIFIELVGFWTRDYLERRLAAYREAGVDAVLCVDTLRAADDGVLPAEVLPYSKTLAIEALLGRLRPS